MNHKEMIDVIDEYIINYTIIKGYCDINIAKFKNYYQIENNEYYVITGNLNDQYIKNTIQQDTFKQSDGITIPGHYQYNACIYFKNQSWDEPGECYIDYIEFQFIESFKERLRNDKINKILY